MIPPPAADCLRTAPALRKSRVGRVMDVALVVILIIAAVIQISLFAGYGAEAAAVFLNALVISTLLVIIPVAILWFLDRRERESPWLLLAAFLWGGCIATALSLPLNSAVFRIVDRWIALNPMVTEILGPDATLLIAAPLSGPIVEEIIKGAGVVLILSLLRDEFDGMRDGFVYGAMVGVGFNWFEAPLYVMQGFVQHGVAPYGLELGARHGLLGLGGHAMFSGLFGLFLGLAAQTSRLWLKVLAPVIGLVLAVMAHLWNNALPLLAALAPTGDEPAAGYGEERRALFGLGFLQAAISASVVQLTLFLPFTVILCASLWYSGRWERRVIREELKPEIGGAVTPHEYQAIVADRLFRTRRIDTLNPQTSAALVNAQHELAFRKRRVRDRGDDAEQDPLVAGWRRDIAGLREQA